MSRFPIVVGADGGGSGKVAVRWAAREARRRGLPLRIAHVFDWEWREARYDMSRDYLELARTQAEGIIAGAVRTAREVAGDIEIEGNPLIGNAAARLIEESAHAELTVLGSRGRGGFGSLLLGSVSQRVATHAAGPVVVVRGRDGAEGPVVAGVDDSPAADVVLRAAFETAATRDASLAVVRSYLPEVPLWLGDVATPVAEGEERSALTAQLAPWRARFPQVPVQLVLTPENVATALVTASERAQLVMVGSRGRGVVTGTILGSAGLQLLHHAWCPVAIVRPALQVAG